MDTENQTTSPGYPLPTFDTRRDNSKAGWPDAWLIDAVRREPPDESALDILVARYGRQLFARCRMLTPDRDAASDLAQESWLRVLRARGTLRSDGNFHAYLMTIATNLWRNRRRSARRAGAMSDSRIESLDATEPHDDQSLMDVLTQPDTLPADEKLLLKLDVDNALERLSPRLRDALVSRYLIGESAAEIARRCDRTEQTISSWIREAVREMRVHLSRSGVIGAVFLSIEMEEPDRGCYRKWFGQDAQQTERPYAGKRSDESDHGASTLLDRWRLSSITRPTPPSRSTCPESPTCP